MARCWLSDKRFIGKGKPRSSTGSFNKRPRINVMVGRSGRRKKFQKFIVRGSEKENVVNWPIVQ